MSANLLGTLNNIVYYFANPVIGFLTLTGLVVIWCKTKAIPSPKYIKLAILINVISNILRSVYSTILNYYLWTTNPATQHLLKFDYVLKFSFNTYWLVTLVTWIFAFLFFKILIFANKKFDNRFFYDEEPYLIALGIILNPWPMLIFFIIACLICLLVLQIINFIRKNLIFKQQKITLERMAFINIWIPAMFVATAIYFVLFTNVFPWLKIWLLNLPFIDQLLTQFYLF